MLLWAVASPQADLHSRTIVEDGDAVAVDDADDLAGPAAAVAGKGVGRSPTDKEDVLI
jgi:hypothetical protein